VKKKEKQRDRQKERKSERCEWNYSINPEKREAATSYVYYTKRWGTVRI
jgi:hypothetical protein